MEDRYYSVDELSGILRLHPKTVRRFIREGRIAGRKIGRAWMVHQEDLKKYAHGELGGGPAGQREAELKSLLPDESRADRITVSAVVELREKDPEEASRISNSIIALLNCRDPEWGKARYDMIHEPERHTARFIFYGTPRFIAAIMKVFDVLTDQEDEE